MGIFKYILKNNKQGVMEIRASNPWKSRGILKKTLKDSKVLSAKSKDWLLITHTKYKL